MRRHLAERSTALHRAACRRVVPRPSAPAFSAPAAAVVHCRGPLTHPRISLCSFLMVSRKDDIEDKKLVASVAEGLQGLSDEALVRVMMSGEPAGPAGAAERGKSMAGPGRACEPPPTTVSRRSNQFDLPS